MPATSEEQQQLFGIALSIKRGKISPSYSPEAAKLAKSMSEEELEEMAEFKGNPNFIYDLYQYFKRRWWF